MARVWELEKCEDYPGWDIQCNGHLIAFAREGDPPWDADEQMVQFIVDALNAAERGCGDDHCWVGGDAMLLTFPPQSTRACKHCGLRQTGRPQEPTVWR